MKLRSTSGGSEHEVEFLGRDHDTASVRIDGHEVAVRFASVGETVVLEIGARRFLIVAARRGTSTVIAVGPQAFEFVSVEESTARKSRGLATPEITAPMPGKVLKLLVADGDNVTPGQPLAVIEAMKMETTLYAESAAIVKRVRVAPGQMVDHGAVLIDLSPAPAAPSPAAPAA